MKGEKQLLAMRKHGRRPRAVWVTDSDDHYSRETARDWHLHRNTADGEYHAHLRIEANDIPAALDLRCVVGLECHLSSDRGEARFNQIFEALKTAGAAVVVGLSNGEVKLHREQQETTHG